MMICKKCGEEFDEKLFPFCPFCKSTYNEEDSFDKEIINIREEKKETIDSAILSSSTSVKIFDVFNDRKCNSFLKYCLNEGMIFMSDLDNFNFDNLKDIRGIGKKKIEYIKHKYDLYKQNYLGVFNDTKNLTNNNVKHEELIFCSFSENISSLSISYLTFFGITNSSITKLNKDGYNTLDSVEEIPKIQLKTYFGINSNKKIELINNYSNVPYKDFFKQCISLILSDITKNSVLKRINGYTLEQIALEYNVTRERIRQIVKKFYTSISMIVKDILLIDFIGKENIYTDDILSYFEDREFCLYLLGWFKQSDIFEYFELYDCFVKKDTNENILEELENMILKKAENENNISTILESIEEYLEEKHLYFVDSTLIEEILKKHGYVIFKNKYYKMNKTLTNLLSLIVDEYYPKGIYIYDHNELNNLRNLIEKNFNFKVDNSDRALTARAASNLVLCDRGKYISKNNASFIPMELLAEIHDYIANSKDTTLYYSEIFDTFKGKLLMLTEIDNYNYLHGIINLYFGDEFKHDRDAIFKSERSEKISMDIKIKNYILENSGIVSRDDLMSGVKGLNIPYLGNIVAADNSIFLWSNKRLTCKEFFNLSTKDLNYFKNLIEDIQINYKGYCNSRILFDLVNESYKKKYRIDDYFCMFSLMNEYFKDEYLMSNPYILDKTIYTSALSSDIILQNLGNPDVLNYPDFIIECKRCRIPNITISLILDEIKKQYVRINQNEYIKNNLCSSLYENIQSIDEILETSFENNGYFAILDISDFQKLPNVGIQWSSELLQDYITKYSAKYHLVEPITKNRKYQRGIIINNSIDIYDYDKFICYYLHLHNILKIHEIELTDMLLIDNIIYKHIPIDLYKSDNILYNNGVFSIK